MTKGLIDLVRKEWRCFSYLLRVTRKLCEALRRDSVYKCIFWLRGLFYPIQPEHRKQLGCYLYHCGDYRRKYISNVKIEAHAALWLLLFTHGGNLLIKLWARGTFVGFLTVTSYFRKHQIKILLADLWNWSYNITRAHWYLDMCRRQTISYKAGCNLVF